MHKKISTFVFQDYLEPIYDIDIDTNDYEYHTIVCYNCQEIYATETLFISNTISLGDILKRDNQQRADFLKFDSLECTTKCTKEKLTDRQHTTEW